MEEITIPLIKRDDNLVVANFATTAKDIKNTMQKITIKINNIFKLCNYSRMELVKIVFLNDEINKIILKLQLNGLDLKHNHAKRNTLLDNY